LVAESTILDVLIVDDEAGIRAGVAYPLSDEGHRVTEAADGAEAFKLLSERVYDVVICDVRLPKVDGLTLLRHLMRVAPSTAVVLMTAYGRVSDVKEALREGAYDYVTKPFDVDQFPLAIIHRIVEERALEAAQKDARDYLEKHPSSIIGRSPPMVRLLDRLDTLSRSDAPVLLVGESGTGKELIARALHDKSARRARPFVAVNCAALPDTLLEAELFGHERGAFTGAVKRREGRFAAADGGTLLLDEIAEIPLPAQAKLLRVLQEGTFEPLGSNSPVPVDVRIISATHQDLHKRVAEGRFREDLYYRLNVLDLWIPPLRERRSDLPLLLEYFLARFTPEGQEPAQISGRAWSALVGYSFPGNVREFAHVIERAVVLSRGRTIELEHLPPNIIGAKPSGRPTEVGIQPLGAAMREFERTYLLRALRLAGDKRGRAAELLCISRKTLWEKLRAHGIVASSAADDSSQSIPLVSPDDD
jgi:DNA-binding NtrC family response regulator